jgi:hypothetical protein
MTITQIAKKNERGEVFNVDANHASFDACLIEIEFEDGTKHLLNEEQLQRMFRKKTIGNKWAER